MAHFDGYTMHYTRAETLRSYKHEEAAQLRLAAASKTATHKRHHEACAWSWAAQIRRLEATA
jgi:hypothetical protein